jgi:hypothetical protein
MLVLLFIYIKKYLCLLAVQLKSGWLPLLQVIIFWPLTSFFDTNNVYPCLHFICMEDPLCILNCSRLQLPPSSVRKHAPCAFDGSKEHLSAKCYLCYTLQPDYMSYKNVLLDYGDIANCAVTVYIVGQINLSIFSLYVT